jgi:hypothetical protein
MWWWLILLGGFLASRRQAEAPASVRIPIASSIQPHPVNYPNPLDAPHAIRPLPPARLPAVPGPALAPPGAVTGPAQDFGKALDYSGKAKDALALAMKVQGMLPQSFSDAQLEDMAKAIEAELANDNPGVAQAAWTPAQYLAAATLVLAIAGVAYGFMTKNVEATIASAAGAVGSAMALAGYAVIWPAVVIAVVVTVCGIIGKLDDAAKTQFAMLQAKRQSTAFAQNVIPSIRPMIAQYLLGDASVLPGLASAAASALYTTAKAGDFGGDMTANQAITMIFTVVSKRAADYPGFLVTVYNILATPGYYGPRDPVGNDPWGVADAWSFLSNKGQLGIPPIYPFGRGVVPWEQYQAAFAQDVTVPGVVRDRSGLNLTLAPVGWSIGPQPAGGLTWQQIQSTPAATIQPKTISWNRYTAAMAQHVIVPGIVVAFPGTDALTLAPGWEIIDDPAVPHMPWAALQSTPAGSIP